jgi:hypothetical protein
MKSLGFSSELEEMIRLRKRDFYYVNGDSILSIIENLKFVYAAVIASENLLSCAIEKLKVAEASAHRDGVLAYFIEHLEEERGHAKWLFNDLNGHGVELSDFDGDAMVMIGLQYYMIYHVHPYCLLGYMAVVEGTPTPISEIEKLEAYYGKKLFRFARYHSIKDEEHKTELFRQMDGIPKQFVEHIIKSANATLDCMSNAAKRWV